MHKAHFLIQSKTNCFSLNHSNVTEVLQGYLLQDSDRLLKRPVTPNTGDLSGPLSSSVELTHLSINCGGNGIQKHHQKQGDYYPKVSQGSPCLKQTQNLLNEWGITYSNSTCTYTFHSLAVCVQNNKYVISIYQQLQIQSVSM